MMSRVTKCCVAALFLLLNFRCFPPGEIDVQTGERSIVPSPTEQAPAVPPEILKTPITFALVQAATESNPITLNLNGTTVIVTGSSATSASGVTPMNNYGRLYSSGAQAYQQMPMLSIALNPTHVCASSDLSAQFASFTMDLPPLLVHKLNTKTWKDMLDSLMKAYVINALLGFYTGFDHFPELVNNLYFSNVTPKLRDLKLCLEFATQKYTLNVTLAIDYELRSHYIFRDRDRTEEFMGHSGQVSILMGFEGLLNGTGGVSSQYTLAATVPRLHWYQSDYINLGWFGRYQFVNNNILIFPNISGSLETTNGKPYFKINWQADYECKMSAGRKGLADGRIVVDLAQINPFTKP